MYYLQLIASKLYHNSEIFYQITVIYTYKLQVHFTIKVINFYRIFVVFAN